MDGHPPYGQGLNGFVECREPTRDCTALGFDSLQVHSLPKDRMPTYDFKCPKGHTFSLVRSINDSADPTCPDCKAQATRVFTAPPISFKGSGFVAERG